MFIKSRFVFCVLVFSVAAFHKSSQGKMQILQGTVFTFITTPECCRKITSRKMWQKARRWSRSLCRAIKEGSDPIMVTVLGKDPTPPGLGQVQNRIDGSCPSSHPGTSLGHSHGHEGGKAQWFLRAVSPLLFVLQIIYTPDIGQWAHNILLYNWPVLDTTEIFGNPLVFSVNWTEASPKQKSSLRLV